MDKHKLDYDLMYGILHRYRMYVDMDQHIYCLCKLFQRDILMKQHIRDDIVVVNQYNPIDMNKRLDYCVHDNYYLDHKVTANMGMDFHVVGLSK